MERKKKTGNPMVRRRKRNALLRFIIQVVFFLAAPSAYASAFSGIKEICTEFNQGAVLQWTSFGAMLVFLLAFTVVFGRFFCGYACAFGAVGDWIYFLSSLVQKKVLKRKKVFQLSDKAVRQMQYLKYVVLLAVLVVCVLGQQSIINGNSPWTVFSFLSGGNLVPAGMEIGIVLLVLIVCGMALQERFFCQFLCPMGAVFSLLPVLPTGMLGRNRENCIKGCSACTKTCPVCLELDADSAKSGECIRCGKCTGICPKQNISLTGSHFKGNEIWMVLVQSAALLIGILVV